MLWFFFSICALAVLSAWCSAALRFLWAKGVVSNANVINGDSIFFGFLISFFWYSYKITGAKGIQKSLCFIALFIFWIFWPNLGSAKILLFPSALCPISALFLQTAIIWCLIRQFKTCLMLVTLVILYLKNFFNSFKL